MLSLLTFKLFFQTPFVGIQSDIVVDISAEPARSKRHTQITKQNTYKKYVGESSSMRNNRNK